MDVLFHGVSIDQIFQRLGRVFILKPCRQGVYPLGKVAVVRNDFSGSREVSQGFGKAIAICCENGESVGGGFEAGVGKRVVESGEGE